jgi:hypothetical protein
MTYFADLADGTTVRFEHVEYDRGYLEQPRGYCADADVWYRVTRRVELKSRPSLHACNARCLNAAARAMQCECSCLGANHGKASVASLAR